MQNLDLLELCLKINLVTFNLVFGGYFVFLAKKLRKVIMNYHAKSGASSFKIVQVQVMINLVFGGHFVFWWPLFLAKKCGKSI